MRKENYCSTLHASNSVPIGGLSGARSRSKEYKTVADLGVSWPTRHREKSCAAKSTRTTRPTDPTDLSDRKSYLLEFIYYSPYRFSSSRFVSRIKCFSQLLFHQFFFEQAWYIYIYTKLRTDINFINKFFPSIRSTIPRIDRIFEIKKYRVLFNFQNLLSIVIQSIDLWSTYFRTIARSSFSVRNFIEMKYFEEFSFHIKESSTSLRYKFSIGDIKFSRRKIVLLSAKNFRVNSWNAAVGQEQLVEIVARMHTSSVCAFCNGDSKRGRRWAPH